MKLFTHHEFDGHEQVVFCHDRDSGLRAIIAIHNTQLGPALGGCRMFPYTSEADALNDVLRLSRGMTYKSAIANLPLGGGKSVIMGDPAKDKTAELMLAMGRAVEQLGGRYIVAEDSGTGVADIQLMAEMTHHVSGIAEKCDALGNCRSGDPSPMTARGTFAGIKAAVRHKMRRDSLEGVRIAIQGVGHVGQHLARYLAKAGAELWLADINPAAVEQLVSELGAHAVAKDAIYEQEVDVFAPCAMGAVINDQTLPRLKANIVAGAANNQLAEPRHGQALAERGILYAPDYVINAGGVIDVCYERDEYDQDRIFKEVDAIGQTLTEIFVRAEAQKRPTYELADTLARERLNR